jgi:integral membrane sensor signal transduction histidine kinase
MNEIFTLPLLSLIISAALITGLLVYVLKIKNKTSLQNIFCLDLLCVFIICVGVILQAILSKLCNIPAINFENYIYIGTCFLPVCILFTGKIFSNPNYKLKRIDLFTLIIPITSLIILWTNNFHHLFYKVYSTNISKCVYGNWLIIHNIYSYTLLLIGIIYIIKASGKTSGFFSKQSLLIIAGMSIPIVVNVLGTFKIIPMSVFITPISFAFAMVFFALAIFKFKFLGIAPIALRTVVNRMSDSYIILNENYVVTDFNNTFLNIFKLKDENIRDKNIIKFLEHHQDYGVDIAEFKQYLNSVKGRTETVSFEQGILPFNKFFTVEINNIMDKNNFLGILILFKDITQHKQDIQTIQNNQDMLMEKERLASLGQLIGGISHNLKTPIMSISGAAEGLTDLINEYDASIGDPEVTNDDHHAIANDMREWITKIHSYTAYMSDIITAVKGQAVNLSENENNAFTVDELFKRVNILMKHEISNASLTLTLDVQVPSSTTLVGDINSLVQVINNLITNAIQSYNGRKGEEIKVLAQKLDNNLIISVIDHGCGMTKEVQDKLFNTMITTKGKNGTGLGMFMSYSTIKGHFNGDITFETEVNKGTTFNVILPLQ